MQNAEDNDYSQELVRRLLKILELQDLENNIRLKNSQNINSQHENLLNELNELDKNSIDNPCDSIEDYTSDLLNSINFKRSLKGSTYVMTALVYISENGLDFLMSKDIYPYVAKVHGTVEKNVERNMRTAIQKSLANDKLKLFYDSVGVRYTPTTPTSREFLVHIYNKYTRDCKNYSKNDKL